MAVQNDNTILKKADLKAYHQQIAGQLGGTFALRTNNGDCLSTDEKVVGVYIDGKPIYQKSFKVMATSKPFTSSNRTWLTIVNNAMQNRDIAWIDEGQSYIYWGASDNAVKPLNCTHQVSNNDYWYFQPSNNHINALSQGTGGLYSIRSVASAYYFITVKYTKTTDQPNSAITSGAYDIAFPNTWPANTEVFLGNGVYGYRATGNMIAIAKGKANQINTTIAPSRLIGCGGSMTVTNIENKTVSRMLGQSVAWVGENTRNTWRSSAVINSNNVLAFLFDSPDPNYGDISSTSDTYDFWVTYTKGGN